MNYEKLLKEILLSKMNKIEEKQDWFEEQLTLFSKAIQNLQTNSEQQSKKSKKKQKKIPQRTNINLQVLNLLIKYSDKVWTSDELAKKIGCTGSAVRKTSAWNSYQKQKNRSKSSISKKFENKNANIIAVTENNEFDN
ncbi:MAG: hypothetical protein LBE18_09390 [Planctomycetaceae bacterium]|jgi:response regulator of citrate/malate metabolism|nr:hypothetical protein [Planctomycetaceae bacterium]